MLSSKPIENNQANELHLVSPTYPLKVFMVEDLPRWQMALQALLETLPNIEVVACTDNFDDAIQAWESLPQSKKPNLALLDFQIIGIQSGLDVAHALEQRNMSPEQIIMVSSSSPQVIGKHPYGYIPKQQAVDALPVAIEGIRQLLVSQALQSG